MWQLELVTEIFAWANILANLAFIIGFHRLFSDVILAHNGSLRSHDGRPTGAPRGVLSRGAPDSFAVVTVVWAAVMISLAAVLSDIPLWGSGMLSVFMHVLAWFPLVPVLLMIASLVVSRAVPQETADSAG
ncbi:MAG: hypothetical protein C4K49_07680 [Candidatus Thorarchaeota archaeon]|nr:MAG: hypothetical protein C4K49_07680 [Candidatus Thorarchaeota archaeon]